MSPVQAMERSYSALKQMLRDGVFAPGARLEANRIAEELGVSMTPVRDVLHRLAGERLVEAASGEGFHVPRLSEGELRDLYEWNSALLLIAVRTARQPLAATSEGLESDAGTLADETADLFDRIAATAPNREIRTAILNAGDRLHPYRIVETLILEPIIGELEEFTILDQGLPQTIRRYHMRRMKAVPDLLRHRDGG